ncbi:MAG: Gfo/Idh/MocA family oxidoreductase, partial [Thermoguttaceae bacterium]|nr:Gfo/Idh/MocA family oxidoreductase [Thermoguttaceae bacterium]
VELTAVYDPLETSRVRLAARYNLVPCENIEKFFDAVDAVVIAAPSSLHFELGKAALARGRHVLMEKPLVTKASDAQSLIDLAHREKVVFQAGHVEQYNPAWLAATEMLDDVRRGEPCLIEATRKSGYTFRCVDIGAVLDIMIHDLELVLSLIPSEVVSVDGFGFGMMGGLEDTAQAWLVFENGSRVALSASRVAMEPVRQMLISTRRHSVRIDFQQRAARKFSPDSQILSGAFAPEKVEQAAISTMVTSFMKDHFALEETSGVPIDALSLEMDNFVSAILKGTPSRVPAKRAAQAVKLAQCILDQIAKHNESH